MPDIDQVMLPDGVTYDVKDYTIRDEVKYQIYNTVADLNLQIGVPSISDAFNAMADSSILIAPNGDFAPGSCPTNGIVEIYRRSGGRASILFHGVMEANGAYRMFLQAASGGGYEVSETWVKDSLEVSTGTVSMSSGTLNSTSSLKKSGNVCSMNLYVTDINIPTSLTQIGTIPAAFRPSNAVMGVAAVGFGANCYIDITSSGQIRIRGASAQSGVAVRAQLNWIL